MLQLSMYSLLDIKIHYEGADYDSVHDLLSEIGISDPAVTRSIYEYIVEEPATYPKYYLGYLEFVSLKEKAETLWGNDFSLYRFHEFILQKGPCDFTTLNELLDATITNLPEKIGRD